MKTLKFILVAAAIGGAFLAGSVANRWHADASGSAAPSGRKILYWVDPMHPWYKSDRPGIAPDCNMALVPVHEGEAGKYEDKAHDDDIRVTPGQQQLIGVEYGTAEYTASTDSIRAVARVGIDETKIAKVHAKLDGWVDQLFVDFTGQLVKQGQPLLTIYSPEALATQNEYLLALKAKTQAHHNPIHELAASTDTLVAAARKRLELWDITTAQLDQVERTGEPLKNLVLESPASGFVVERNVYAKQRVTPDTPLYTIADLSTVWVMADVYEYEASRVRLGQSARLTLPYTPGRTYTGKVSYILPQVDPTTRTLKVRIEFANPGFALKPDMYGDVEIATGGGRRLTVPASAVVNTGDRQVVFLDKGNGYFEPRNVKIGEQIGDRTEILAGLSAGERIVTTGNFLIDSESQLKSGGPK